MRLDFSDAYEFGAVGLAPGAGVLAAVVIGAPTWQQRTATSRTRALYVQDDSSILRRIAMPPARVV